MDWRGRKYYAVKFPHWEHDYRVRMLKLIEGITMHPPTDNTISRRNVAYDDEASPRGYYHYVIGCPENLHEAVEYELRKASRNGCGNDCWHEIMRIKNDNSRI